MFRIFESIEYFCQCMSRSVLMRLEKTANIFLMKIRFIRHGDPDYGNDTLTEKGRKEA